MENISCGGLNNDGIRGVEILVKVELCKKIVEVHRKINRVVAMVLVFEEKVIRVICAYGPQVGGLDYKKNQFHNYVAIT